MTDDEKNIMKGMSQIIFDLIWSKTVLESALKKNLANWEGEVQGAAASEICVQFRQHLQEIQQAIERMIDQDDPSGLLARIPRGQVN